MSWCEFCENQQGLAAVTLEMQNSAIKSRLDAVQICKESFQHPFDLAGVAGHERTANMVTKSPPKASRVGAAKGGVGH